MKKVFCFVLSLLMIVCMCACNNTNTNGKGTTPATIVTNNGETVMMTAEELIGAAQNQAKFDQLYRGASIKFTGKVEKVATSMAYNGGSFYDIIFFEEGWIVKLPEDVYDNGPYANILASIDVGDCVTVESDICSCNPALKEIDIRGMANDNIGFDDDSMMKTKITLG